MRSVCLFVCASVCVSVSPRAYLWNRWTDLHEFFCADPLCRGSVLWQRCDMLCTYGVMDDITFGRNGPYGASGGQIPRRSDICEFLVYKYILRTSNSASCVRGQLIGSRSRTQEHKKSNERTCNFTHSRGTWSVFSRKAIFLILRTAEIKGLVKCTLSHCSVTVSYTHLTLPTNREV